ncbi:LamG-like jellyroll fold domain-containing protein [Thermomonospora umbrina]|uniref:LamG-like jellyroll fold domain-containing protein n=1 Tax=Thermomonospora umbrina TaxID=111806 RepID=UPI0011C11AE9|nr:LamG-like jellyroll fold domain-containing protein [Thermomonospora umbrina]
MSGVLIAGLLQVPWVAAAVPAVAEETTPGSAVSVRDAVEEARRSGGPVAVSSLTGAQQDVTAQPNGAVEFVAHSEPVRTLRDGKWTPLDLALRRQADGSFAPGAAVSTLWFSGGGDGPFVRMSRAGRELALTWPHGRLPAPVVEGDKAEYRGVLGPDVDLVLRATPSGFSHVIRVKTAEAAADSRLAALTLGLGAGGLKVQSASGGGLTAVDAGSGGVVFRADKPIMWDSPGTAPAGAVAPRSSASDPAPVAADLSAAPADGSKVAAVQAVPEAGSLTLRPDAALLKGSDTRFPVYVDPQWKTPGESAAVMVGTEHTSASWTDEGMGLCDDADEHMDDCGGRVTKRLFYKFVLPDYTDGWNVRAAEFKPTETHAYNCTASEMTVWRTNGVSGSTSWDAQNSFGAGNFWFRKLLTDSNAFGNDKLKCADTTLTLSSEALRDEVENVSHAAGDTIWLGMKAVDEGSVTGWKRFDNDASLRVLFNLPPDPPRAVRTITTDGAHECRPKENPLYLTEWPKMQAQIWDPQTDDMVAAEYLVGWGDRYGNNAGWQIGDHSNGLLHSGADKSGAHFTKSLGGTVNGVELPKFTPIRWMVRGHDFDPGRETGNPSDWVSTGFWSQYLDPGGLNDPNATPGHPCWFVYDNTKPAPPKISSSDYPDDGNWHDGVGRTGRFTFEPGPSPGATAPLTQYLYEFFPPGSGGMGQKPVNIGSSACAGHKCTIPFAPTAGGTWELRVRAVSANGQGGEGTYRFLVRRSRGEAAHWRLDDTTGTTLRDEITVAGGYRPDGHRHQATLVGGDHGLAVQSRIDSKALRLNSGAGGSYAETGEPLVDPSESYSVSAWVRPTASGTYPTVVGQDGSNVGAFRIEFASHNGHWAMTGVGADSVEGSISQVYSKQPARLGQWTHLVGVHNAATKQLSLYVDGQLQQTTGYDAAAWATAELGPFSIGRWKWNGTKRDFFRGELDDVRVFTRAVTEGEVASWYRPTVHARWKLNAPAGQNVTTGDDSGAGRLLQLKNGAKIVASDNCPVTTKSCLDLGQTTTGAYAETTGPVVDTAGSFTMAGWAAPSATGEQPQVVWSASGAQQSAVTVRLGSSRVKNDHWNPDFDPPEEEWITVHRWEAEMAASDDAGTARKMVWHSVCNSCEGTPMPDHLAVSYNADTDVLTLLVNGAADPSGDNRSAMAGVTGFTSSGPLQVGRGLTGGTSGGHLSGLVDDVWAVKGALTANEVVGLGVATTSGVGTEVDNFHGNPKLPFIYPDSPPGAFRVVNASSGKCLTVVATASADAHASGANVVQRECAGGQRTQMWKRVERAPGVEEIVGVDGGRCVDVAGVSTADGADIVQWGCIASAANQSWRPTPVTGGFKVVAQHSNKCMDVPGQPTDDVVQWTCVDGRQSQTWRFDPVNEF